MIEVTMNEWITIQNNVEVTNKCKTLQKIVLLYSYILLLRKVTCYVIELVP